MEDKKTRTTKKIDLLTSVESIVYLAKESKLNKEFYRKADKYLKYMSEKLELTKEESVMIAMFINWSDNGTIQFKDICEYVNCPSVCILRYTDVLESREFIRCRHEKHGRVSYRVPFDVIEAFKRNEKYIPRKCTNLTCLELFAELEDIFEQRKDNELTFETMASKIQSLFTDNPQIKYVQKVKELVRLHSKNLIRYQDTYAEQMAAYGLQRGIKGSEAQHISTHEYYRSLIAQGEGLQANVTQLLEEQEKARLVIAEAEQAKKDLARIKAETKTEELKSSTLVACLSKNSATKTGTSVLNGVNSLLGGNKVNRMEKENAQLHREVEDLNDQIERLHTDMQKMKDSHARELTRTNEQHQQEVSNLKRILDKAYRWFPSFKRFLNMERECLQYGFNAEQTDKLVHGQTVNYSGWLHSNEYRRNALANNVTAQVIRDEMQNLFLRINETPIAQWFKEQLGIGQSEIQRKGIRL